jgi:hypothetical protein
MSTEGTALSDILSDEPAVEAPVVEAAPDTPELTEEAPTEPVRDEMGRFAAKTGVDDTAPPADGLPKEEYKAIREEREKRQNLERELETLRNTVQTLQQPKEPPAPPPSIWEDEKGALAHNRQETVDEAAFRAALNTSEMLCRDRFDDFDEMKAKFLELANANPSIAHQALADPHPWRKAYQTAQNAVKMEQLGAVDVADLEAKIEARVREEMAAQSSVIPQPTVPLSLTGERSVGTRSGPAWSGPKPLDQLLG